MDKFVKTRLGCFSELIRISGEEISKKLLPLHEEKITTNLTAIVEDCETFLYGLLDQIVLPYSVYSLSKKQKRGETVSFDQFFLESDWMAEWEELNKHATCQVNLSIRNLEKALTRLKNDWCQLKVWLGISDQSLVRLENISVTASDRHNSGQQALLFSFDVGGKVVRMLYKPRSMMHLSSISEFFPELLVPDVYANSPEYGWQEFIDYGEPDDMTDYYFRAGRTLAFYSALDGTDAHFQNVIACPLGPVIIDWETIFTNTSYFKRQGVDTDMVDFTGLVQGRPDWWKFWQRGAPLNAGLHANGDSQHNMLGIHAINDGTDRVAVCYNQFVPYVFTNKPQQEFTEANKYVIDGFCNGIKAIKKISWKEARSAFESCFDNRFRQLIRHTAFYKWLTLQSLNPGILRDFQKESVRVFFSKKLEPVSGRTDFIDYEQDCLFRGDVPIFYQRPHSKDLYDGDGKAYTNFFAETAHAELAEKWEHIKHDSFLQKNVKLLEKVAIGI